MVDVRWPVFLQVQCGFGFCEEYISRGKGLIVDLLWTGQVCVVMPVRVRRGSSEWARVTGCTKWVMRAAVAIP
jgi:hypothetical protein